MPEQKYKIGDLVEVKFLGEVKSIQLTYRNTLKYEINTGISTCYVEEEYVNPARKDETKKD